MVWDAFRSWAVCTMHRTAKYYITFTPKCFALAVAAVSAELKAILLNKVCKILQFLHSFYRAAWNADAV